MQVSLGGSKYCTLSQFTFSPPPVTAATRVSPGRLVIPDSDLPSYYPTRAEYKKDAYWWEVLELMRKVTLTSYLFLVPPEQQYMRIVIALVISICFLSLMVTFQVATSSSLPSLSVDHLC